MPNNTKSETTIVTPAMLEAAVLAYGAAQVDRIEASFDPDCTRERMGDLSEAVQSRLSRVRDLIEGLRVTTILKVEERLSSQRPLNNSAADDADTVVRYTVSRLGCAYWSTHTSEQDARGELRRANDMCPGHRLIAWTRGGDTRDITDEQD
jgi:hypothetical protein